MKQAFLARRKPLTPAEVNVMDKVLDRIGREGPLMVKDFENDRSGFKVGYGCDYRNPGGPRRF